MQIRGVILAAVLAMALAVPVEAQQSPEGVWTFVEIWGETAEGPWKIGAEQKQPNLWIMTEGYYSIAGVGGMAPRPMPPEGATRQSLTPEQAAGVWIPYTSNSGTYEIRGSTIINHPMVALWPMSMAEGAEFTFEFEWDGEDLLVTETLYGTTYTGRLKRLR
jgi:hypothetical protein